MSKIETLDDLAECFSKLGWTLARDEVGFRYAQLRLGNKIVQPGLSRRDTRYPKNPNGYLLFEMGGSICEDAISAAYTLMIYPKKRITHSCLVANSPNYKIQKPLVYEKDVAEISDAWIAWGHSYNMEAGLKALRELPTNSIGAFPARHLAALAAHGDVETLLRYRKSFEQGDRLGFVPYITTDHIITSIAFAERRRTNPSWLPSKPRMRV